MSRERHGNVGVEPLPETALTAQEARDLMKTLENVVGGRAGFATKGSVTVRCWRNQEMSEEYARELYRLITEEYGVPLARFISPTPEGAGYLFAAAAEAGRPESLRIFGDDGARTGQRYDRLEDYQWACGYEAQAA